MTDPVDRKADGTRLHILRAASRQFAHKPYGLVSLDDILADAKVTKGAMYFHFRSKFALASAIVTHQTDIVLAEIDDIHRRGLSGLETLVDITYYMAAREIADDAARATLNLLASIFRFHELQSTIVGQWIDSMATIARRSITEGDIAAGQDPHDVGRLLVALYLGIRQTCTPDEPERFLTVLQQAWLLVLPGFTNPDRAPFLTQFVRRRTMLAIRRATAAPGSPPGA